MKKKFGRIFCIAVMIFGVSIFAACAKESSATEEANKVVEEETTIATEEEEAYMPEENSEENQSDMPAVNVESEGITAFNDFCEKNNITVNGIEQLDRLMTDKYYWEIAQMLTEAIDYVDENHGAVTFNILADTIDVKGLRDGNFRVSVDEYPELKIRIKTYLNEMEEELIKDLYLVNTKDNSTVTMQGTTFMASVLDFDYDKHTYEYVMNEDEEKAETIDYNSLPELMSFHDHIGCFVTSIDGTENMVVTDAEGKAVAVYYGTYNYGFNNIPIVDNISEYPGAVSWGDTLDFQIAEDANGNTLAIQ